MRMRSALLAGVLVTLTALPAQASSLTLVVPPVVSKLASNETLTVSGVGTFDAPATVQVFTDGTLDDETLLEATPPAQDLIAGFVGVDRAASELILRWKVLDLPDIPGGLPEVIRYMWEFEISAPGGAAAHFSAIAKFSNVISRNGPQTALPAGELTGNCMETDFVVTVLITCSRLAEPPVAFDGVANEITMRIAFGSLQTAGGVPLMVNGAGVREVQSPVPGAFRGIVAIPQVVLSSGAFGDVADMAPFMLGNHAQVALVPPGLTDDELSLEAMTLAAAAPDGSFSTTIDLTSFPPGTYEVVGRPCTDAGCGAFVRATVTVTL